MSVSASRTDRIAPLAGGLRDGAGKREPALSGRGSMRARFVRLGLPLVAMICVFAAAVVVIVVLQSHTYASLDARAKLGDVQNDLNVIQSVPWDLAGPKAPSAAADAALARKLAAAEHDISLELEYLLRRSPAAGLTAVPAPVRANFVLLEQIRVLIARGQVNGTGGPRDAADRTHGAITTLLARAGDE